jgi:hypothetical protein
MENSRLNGEATTELRTTGDGFVFVRDRVLGAVLVGQYHEPYVVEARDGDNLESAGAKWSLDTVVNDGSEEPKMSDTRPAREALADQSEE